jgi:hypothetical protein
MMITSGVHSDKINATMNQIAELASELGTYCQQSAADGERQYDVERGIWQRMLQWGKKHMDLYLQLLGDGDLGATVTTSDGQELSRSEEPVDRRLRTVFGEHIVSEYVYAPGSKQKIALWPIDAQIELPEGVHSDLYREFSQYFCVDQSFGRASQLLEKMLGQKACVDSLERINRRMGEQAEQFFDELSTPPASQEGQLLVVTADGKGVPLVKEDAQRVPAFDKRERPGNRRMATLGSVYSVDRHVRTPQDILAALFREEREQPATPRPKRPEPQFKELLGRFSRIYEDETQEITVPGAMETFTWIAERVEQRRHPGQRVIRLMDGQPSLWDTANHCLQSVPAKDTVDILDVIHVSSYVWRAAKVFESTREHREAFAWTRLKRILEGDVRGVISGLRQMASKRGLKGKDRQEIRDVCRYFENNRERMRYDEYLREGYPIATGVIEGACRHVVKDRMERSGMRWRLGSAQAMLHVRCVLASSYWDDFQQQRMAAEQKRIHPHAHLVHSNRPPPIKA